MDDETASAPRAADGATEDLARQLEETNLAFLKSGAGSDEAAEAQRTRRLVVAITANYVFFALVLGVAGAAFGDRKFMLASAAAAALAERPSSRSR